MKLIKWRASRDSASHFFLSATAASDSADYSADWGLSRTLFSPSLTLNTLSSTHSVVLSLFSISPLQFPEPYGAIGKRDKLVKRNAGELDLDGGWERVRRKKKTNIPPLCSISIGPPPQSPSQRGAFHVYVDPTFTQTTAAGEFCLLRDRWDCKQGRSNETSAPPHRRILSRKDSSLFHGS